MIPLDALAHHSACSMPHDNPSPPLSVAVPFSTSLFPSLQGHAEPSGVRLHQ